MGLLAALLDSWDRNQAILVNLLRAVPEGGLEARATADGPSVAQLFSHVHSVRLAFVAENAPEIVDAEERGVGDHQRRQSLRPGRRLPRSGVTPGSRPARRGPPGRFP